MAESQVTIRFEAGLWRRFKAVCLLRDTAPTHVLNRFVVEQVRQWENADARTGEPVAQGDAHE